MNYIYHIKSPISLICIAPHKCQRKLCVECMYDHGVDTKQTVPINKFQDKAMKKLKDSKPGDTSKLNEQRMIFKVLLTQIDQMLKKILEELSQSIKQVYDQIEKENQSYLNLINENTNLAESSYTDIEKLVNIVDGPTLYNWNVEKNSYLIDLNKQKSLVGSAYQDFYRKVRRRDLIDSIIDQVSIQVISKGKKKFIK
ncbi:unnamed protein product [Paramecium primaurelia]|uniref:Uncharacterized protein n=1 Tax=Paramecium primaurelia TaxID=5886 RepID=A0A8S1NSM2_PARPR|nr:unnamed protein product [Paramecium primaurelia]